MEELIEISTGDLVLVKDVMIDIDGTNLEEGIDVYLNDEYMGYIIGETADSITAETLEMHFDFF